MDERCRGDCDSASRVLLLGEACNISWYDDGGGGSRSCDASVMSDLKLFAKLPVCLCCLFFFIVDRCGCQLGGRWIFNGLMHCIVLLISESFNRVVQHTFGEIAHFAKLMRLARLYMRKLRVYSCSLALSGSEPTKSKATPWGVLSPVSSISRSDI